MRLSVWLSAVLTLAPSLRADDPELAKARETLIPDLVGLLRHPLYYGHSIKRSPGGWAKDTLVLIGEPAVPALIKALQTDNDYIRTGAAEALAGLKEAKATRDIKSAYLAAKEPWAKSMLLRSLAIVGREEAVDFMLQAIDPDDLQSLRSLLYQLGETKSPRAIPTLSRYYRMSFDSSKFDGLTPASAASLALSNIGRPALPMLRQDLSSPDKEVRLQAANTILGMDDEAALPDALSILKRAKDFPGVSTGWASWLKHKEMRVAVIEMIRTGNLETKASAVSMLRSPNHLTSENQDALGRLLSENCRNEEGENRKERRYLLIGLADLVNMRSPEGRSRLRKAIEWMIGDGGFSPQDVAPLVEVLAQAPDQDALPLLLKLSQVKGEATYTFLYFGSSTQAEAASGCARLGDPAFRKLTALWKQGLVDSNAYTMALIELEDTKSIPLLVAAVNSSDKSVREYSISSLARMEDPRVDPALRELLQNPDTKAYAAKALMRRGDEAYIREAAKTEVGYEFETAVGKAPTKLLEELLKAGSPSARTACTFELVKRNHPAGIQAAYELARDADGKDDDDKLADEIDDVENTDVLRRCLTVKSVHIRAVAYQKLKELLATDNS